MRTTLVASTRLLRTILPAALVCAPLALTGCSDASPARSPLAHRQAPVIGGHPTAEGKFPAVGALLDDSGSFFCTGTLIRSDVVLTAAHCLAFLEPNAQLGFTFVNDTHSGALASVKAKRFVFHEGFSFDGIPPQGVGQPNDIGLIVLDKPVTDVTPIKLPTAEEAKLLATGTELTLVGYGVITPTGEDEGGVKFDAVTDLVTVAEFELQLSSTGQPQNCYGDSGGPALATLGGGERVVGVVSRSAGAEDDPNCDKGGIDTRVDAYLDWIAAQLGEEPPPPPADAGVPDAATPTQPDANPGPNPDDGDGGGCSCQAGRRGRSSGAMGGLAMLMVLGGALMTRRKRA
jgi:MYXO-CTERM domain-containing protein